MALTNGDKDMKTAGFPFAFMVVSIIGNAVTSRFSKITADTRRLFHGS